MVDSGFMENKNEEIPEVSIEDMAKKMKSRFLLINIDLKHEDCLQVIAAAWAAKEASVAAGLMHHRLREIFKEAVGRTHDLPGIGHLVNASNMASKVQLDLKQMETGVVAFCTWIDEKKTQG